MQDHSLRPRHVGVLGGNSDPLSMGTSFPHHHHAQSLRISTDGSELAGLVVQSPRDKVLGDQTSGNVRLSCLQLHELDRLDEFLFGSQTANQMEIDDTSMMIPNAR
jgi:hypothetical protein